MFTKFNSNHNQKLFYLREILKLTEKMKGNVEAQEMLVHNLFCGKLSMYEQTSTGLPLFPENSTSAHESALSDEQSTSGHVDFAEFRQSMKRAAPPPASNH
jgi:hypothetical protein